MSYNINPVFLTDSYKLSHKHFEVEGTSMIYANGTFRFDNYFKAKYPDFDHKIVWFGMQRFIIKILIDTWNKGFFSRPKEDVMKEIKRLLLPYIGMDKLKHFEDLYDIGYLPIEIKSLPEGCLVDIGIPVFTIKNTHPDFEWLSNYLETVISVEIWKPATVATVSRQFHLLSKEFAKKTVGGIDGIEFQNHDFSFRGQSGWESSAANGCAFLLNSWGTDNVPALCDAEYYYKADIEKEPLAFSVAASEHSVTTLGINSNDSEDLAVGEQSFLYDVLVNKFPKGIVSYVADSYDYWRTISDIIPSLKPQILARDGKLVIRPDSGDPVKVVCGYKYETNISEAFRLNKLYFDGKTLWNTVEAGYDEIRDEWFGYVASNPITSDINEIKGSIEVLWDHFGGTITDKGYKLLDSHIGLIYGDGITYQRAKEIFTLLEEKGFASTNVVFGVGSYSLNLLSRDDLGFAIKATAAIVNDKFIPLCKDPKTDTSKKSAKGLLQVSYDADRKKYILNDNVSPEMEQNSCLETVFRDGALTKQVTFGEVRHNAKFMR